MSQDVKLIPVWSEAKAQYFIPKEMAAPENVEIEGVAFQTLPLKIDQAVSLLGISQTDALLETGLMDSTDIVDVGIRLKSLWLWLPRSRQLVEIKAAKLPSAHLFYQLGEPNVEMKLDFHSLPAVQVTGRPEAKPVQLEIHVSGTLHRETGMVHLMALPPKVHGTADEFSTKYLEGATLEGYTLEAYRFNPNRRPR